MDAISQLDELVFRAVLGDSAASALLHHTTAALHDVIDLPSEWPRTVLEEWNAWSHKFESEGFESDASEDERIYPGTAALDAFARVNTAQLAIPHQCGFQMVDTFKFKSKQLACDTVPNCSGWWRFSRAGFNDDHTQAIVHVDYDHPRHSLMGWGHFMLLNRTSEKWSIVAREMTWIS